MRPATGSATKTRRHENQMFLIFFETMSLLRVFVPSWQFRTSELEPHRELRLPRRCVDVGQQRRARAEHRPAGRIVAGADIAARRREVRAIENVEQLGDEFGAL